METKHAVNFNVGLKVNDVFTYTSAGLVITGKVIAIEKDRRITYQIIEVVPKKETKNARSQGSNADIPTNR